jgi:hypothetical protein
VVLPDLQKRRKEVVRVFSRVMGSAKPFNISIGIPLDQYPIVALALLASRFLQRDNPFRARRAGSSARPSSRRRQRARRAHEARGAAARQLGATVSLPKLIAFLDKSLV